MVVDDVGVGEGQDVCLSVCLHNHCDWSMPSFAVQKFGKINLDQKKERRAFLQQPHPQFFIRTTVRRMVLPSKRQVKRNPWASWCKFKPCSRARRGADWSREQNPLRSRLRRIKAFSYHLPQRSGSAPGLFLTWLNSSSSSSRAGSALCCFFVCVVMAIPLRAPM